MSEASRYSIRVATARDVEVLWEILYYASHSDEDPGVDSEALKSRPELARYVAGWGRRGDLGVIAIETESSTPVGAAWLRLFPPSDPGYGYVDEHTPELAIALVPGHRGLGAGSALLGELLARAKQQFSAVSLSVRMDNPARRLYERMGFVLVPGSEKPNRVGGMSGVMIARSLSRHPGQALPA